MNSGLYISPHVWDTSPKRVALILAGISFGMMFALWTITACLDYMMVDMQDSLVTVVRWILLMITLFTLCNISRALFPDGNTFITTSSASIHSGGISCSDSQQ